MRVRSRTAGRAWPRTAPCTAAWPASAASFCAFLFLSLCSLLFLLLTPLYSVLNAAPRNELTHKEAHCHRSGCAADLEGSSSPDAEGAGSKISGGRRRHHRRNLYNDPTRRLAHPEALSETTQRNIITSHTYETLIIGIFSILLLAMAFIRFQPLDLLVKMGLVAAAV